MIGFFVKASLLAHNFVAIATQLVGKWQTTLGFATCLKGKLLAKNNEPDNWLLGKLAAKGLILSLLIPPLGGVSNYDFATRLTEVVGTDCNGRRNVC